MPTSRIRDYYVRPCVDGNSSTGEFFNFTLSLCEGNNCSIINSLPGASMGYSIVVSLTGISGQVVALIYLYSGSPLSSHRTMFYELLASLIWKDLIGKIITTPQPLLSYYYGEWVGGALTCSIHGYCMALIGLVTHLLVAAMALERYIGIAHVCTYRTTVTTSRTRLGLVCLLLFSMMYCGLPFIGIGEFKVHYPGSWCHINQHICQDHPLKNKVFENLYYGINLSCLAFIVLINIILIGILYRKRFRKPTKYFVPRSNSKRKAKERELQLIILLIVITLSFLVSWVTHDFQAILNQVWPQPPYVNPIFDMQAIRLAAYNQILEPWSYIICRMIFRSKFWKTCSNALQGTLSSSSFAMESSFLFTVFSSKLKTAEPRKSIKRYSLPTQKELFQSSRKSKASSGKYGSSFETDSTSSFLRANTDSSSIKQHRFSCKRNCGSVQRRKDLKVTSVPHLSRSLSWTCNGHFTSPQIGFSENNEFSFKHES